jgi:hypothetical protein
MTPETPTDAEYEASATKLATLAEKVLSSSDVSVKEEALVEYAEHYIAHSSLRTRMEGSYEN